GLLVLCEGRLLRYVLGSDPTKLPRPEVVISAKLEDPQRVVLDGQGLIYISDWGKSHQVKVFSQEGILLRTIGAPGGPQLGKYDPQRLHYPRGMALTPDGRLWVAE